MNNPFRNWGAAGIVATSLLAGGMPVMAATYNWCPTASSGAIICNNCTVNLTCDLSGFGLTIRGRYVTLDGQGHSISGYNPSNPKPAINDLGTGTTIKNVNVYFPGTGIFVSQEGAATGAKTVRNSGVFGSLGNGVQVFGIVNPVAIPFAQTTYVRDVWSHGNGHTGFYQSLGDGQLGANSSALGFYERIDATQNGNGQQGGGIFTHAAKIELANSNLSGNYGSGVNTVFNWHGRIYGNTADYNSSYGFYLGNNQDTWLTQNYGHGNGNGWAGGIILDCTSHSGAQWGVWNDFGTAFGPGCTN